jgi:hypothetical protein
MRVAFVVAVLVGLRLLGGCSTAPPTCPHDAGESCACTSTDTVRSCTNKGGQAGLEVCENGMWSDCALFVDGGNPD